MRWPKSYLGEFFDIKHGYAFQGEYFGSTGEYIVLTPGNFYEEGGFRTRDGKEKYYTTDPPMDYILREGDLILAMTEQGEGLLGSPAIVPKGDLYLHNQRLGLVTNLNEEALDKKFLYYLFHTSDVRNQIRATATGTKVKHTAPKRILNVEVSLPDITIQRRTASIISTYDDLIENNNGRIALLEEAIHRLYKEWFVHLRFPGYEHTPIIDGIPNGWVRSTIGESFEVLGGGTPSRKTESYWADGTINWYTPSDLTKSQTMFSESSGEQITEQGLASSSARIFPPYSVMMTSRATIGAISVNTIEATTNQGFITCIPNERIPLYFLYCWLKQNTPVFENLATGATFKEITKGVFKKIPICLPPIHLLQEFEYYVQPFAKSILNFQKQNEYLIEARDALLPRLMNGTLAV